jgi:hypothetical protein
MTLPAEEKITAAALANLHEMLANETLPQTVDVNGAMATLHATARALEEGSLAEGDVSQQILLAARTIGYGVA